MNFNPAFFMGTYNSPLEAFAACLFPMAVAFLVGMLFGSRMKSNIAQPVAYLVFIIAAVVLLVMMVQTPGGYASAPSDEKYNALFGALLLFMITIGIVFEHRYKPSASSRFTIVH